MNKYKRFITLLLIFIIISNISFSQEPKQTDFSEYKLTDILSTPDGTLFLSTDSAGIFISKDEGKTWTLTSKITKDFSVSAMIYDDYEGLWASTLNEYLLQSTDYGKTWRMRLGSAGLTAATLFITHKKYKLLTFGNIAWGTRFSISLDNHNILGFDYKYIPQFAYDNDGYLYSCGSNMLRNKNIDDFSIVWEDVTNNLSVFSNCITINENNRIFLGTKSGIYYSDSKGDKWQLLTSDLQTKEITSLLVKNKQVIAGTIDDGVYYSSNGGNNFIHSNSPAINSAVIKIMPFKSQLFILSKQNGLLFSNDNGQNIVQVNALVDLQADSVFAQGWMPSINFKDIYPDNNSILMISFLNNDSMFMVKAINGKYQFYNTETGILQKEYSLPYNINLRYYSFLSTDSLLAVKYDNSKYEFGILNTITNNFKVEFSIDSSYFYDEYYKIFSPPISYSGPEFSLIDIDYGTKKVYLKYRISGMAKGVNPYRYVYKNEIRDLETGEIIKSPNWNTLFSQNFEYYLQDNIKLFTSKDELIYDFRYIQENLKYSLDSINFSVKISPNNKFIVFDDKRERRFLVADFKTGIILKFISYKNIYNNELSSFSITNDDNYIITSSDESTLKIYNLHNSSEAFDKVVFWQGNSDWKCALANNSNKVLFGGTDGVVRLWQPNFNLTSVKDEEEFQKPEDNSFIYPNPASEYIEINVGAIHELPLQEIQIFDVFGEPVLSVETQNFVSLQKIDVSTLPPGVYFVRIGNEKPLKFVKI